MIFQCIKDAKNNDHNGAPSLEKAIKKCQWTGNVYNYSF